MDQKKESELHFEHSEVLLIVPPFADLVQPSLACHILQAIARERGFGVQVLYGNIIFASIMGESAYRQGVTKAMPSLILERFFGTFAYDMPVLGEEEREKIEPEILRDMDRHIPPLLERIGEIVARIKPKVVGCTSSYEQISTSVAILNQCKKVLPEVTTIMGGANCEDEMADGIFSLGGQVDHVFSGESEETFPEFLEQFLRKGDTPDKIYYGKPCNTLDLLPRPAYHEFFTQYDHFLPESPLKSHGMLGVPYETSRGCWWGQKHHCTFCGLNGGGMAFRKKSAERALDDFIHLVETYPVKRINVVDNIMPFDYFQTLLPKMAEALPEDLEIFYEQKSNLTLRKVVGLRNARISRIQPGIETLSSPILEIMDKGVKGYQNLALMRYARAVGMGVSWNLLCAFPGDRKEYYEELLELIPLITHLQPPDGPGPLRIDRFSPYFIQPEKYGITNVRPMGPYFRAFPEHADIFKLAYHFDGDYDSGLKGEQDLVKRLTLTVQAWQNRWESKDEDRPRLKVIRLFGNQYVLRDTRGLEGCEEYQFLTPDQVRQILVGGAPRDRNRLEWAIRKKLVVEWDGRLVPLPIAPIDMLMDIEENTQGYKEMQERLVV